MEPMVFAHHHPEIATILPSRVGLLFICISRHAHLQETRSGHRISGGILVNAGYLVNSSSKRRKSEASPPDNNPCFANLPSSKANEKEKAPGDDDGFLWRMETWWHMEERDAGVYVQNEAVTLDATGLGWLIEPFITNIPKESLEFTLQALRKAALFRKPL